MNEDTLLLYMHGHGYEHILHLQIMYLTSYREIDVVVFWGGGGIYTILVIGEWPVLFVVKRELAIFLNVTCELINSGDW